MTPMTEPSLSAAPAVPAYRDMQRVTLPRVMRSEWTKLRSLPSTLWLLVATRRARRRRQPAGRPAPAVALPRGHAAIAAFDPAGLSLTGVGLAELTAGALGVLLVTGEYATGQIRLTFAAVPRRLPVLWGKAVAIVPRRARGVPCVHARRLLRHPGDPGAASPEHHPRRTPASRGPSSAARCC